MGARRLYSDEFAAIVQGVLASLPAPLVPEADLDAVAAELAHRLIALGQPRQRGLFGFRAITDAYGADSYWGVHARVMMGMHKLELRHRELQHREAEARRDYVPAA